MGKNLFYSAARWAIVLAVILSLGAGGGSGSVSKAEPEAVAQAVTGVLDMSQMLEGDNQLIKRFYGLDPAQFEACILYYPTTNMMAEELLIVKLADNSQQEMVRKAAEKRIETQKTTFEGYGVEQFQMLTENAVIEVRGNYVLFVVAPNSAEARAAFLKAL